jgi:hypothetical protein
MPLYRKKDEHGYEKFLNIFTDRYVYTHRHFVRECPRGSHIHHANFNKNNNSVSKERRLEHRERALGDKNPNYRHGRDIGRSKSRVINHKILKVEDCGYARVYDLEIANTHNFALSSGVFVHNSKDICDAVCGVVRAVATGLAKATDTFSFTFAGSEIFGDATPEELAIGMVRLPEDALPGSVGMLNNPWGL